MEAVADNLVAWHMRFYGEDQEGDSEEDLLRLERRIGVRLPKLLRDVLARTYLRESQQVHLEPLDGIRWSGDVLVFARDQQDSWQWGIGRSALGEPDPVLMESSSGRWKADLCTFSQWFRFYVLVNRPHEAPCTPEPTPFPYSELKNHFEPLAFRCSGFSLVATVWFGVHVVADEMDGCVMLGAASNDLLVTAVSTLGLGLVEGDLILEEVPL